jgi:hypothetical protein
LSTTQSATSSNPRHGPSARSASTSRAIASSADGSAHMASKWLETHSVGLLLV